MLADTICYTNRGPPAAWANGSIATYSTAIDELQVCAVRLLGVPCASPLMDGARHRG